MINSAGTSADDGRALLITQGQAVAWTVEHAARGRTLLGLAGAPGAGKSTLAAALARSVPGAVVVPMDGFHRPTSWLAARGLVERRGAPETFDAEGYLALLAALRSGGDVRAPDFDRTREEPVPDAICVPADAPLVITEGNYLLLDTAPWSRVRELLDETWFVEVPEDVRVERLVSRFVAYGWDPGAARDRVLRGSDAENAHLVIASRARADLVVAPDPIGQAVAMPSDDIRQLSTREVYRSPWMRLREDQVEFADGSRGTYSVVDKDDFVIVLARENDGFWLVQQYRYPVQRREWEFPQGGWPTGHGGTALELAAAELREETGLRAAEYAHLGRLFAGYGFCSQGYDVYLATGLSHGAPERESTEADMVHEWRSDAALRDMLRRGEFVDAHSIAALALYDNRA